MPFQIPSDGCCWRGAGFDNRYRDFFVQVSKEGMDGVTSCATDAHTYSHAHTLSLSLFHDKGTRFRVPGLLATSKKESTARKFMNRIVADQSRVCTNARALSRQQQQRTLETHPSITHMQVLFQIFFDDSRYLTNVQHFKHGSSGKVRGRLNAIFIISWSTIMIHDAYHVA